MERDVELKFKFPKSCSGCYSEFVNEVDTTGMSDLAVNYFLPV